MNTDKLNAKKGFDKFMSDFPELSKNSNGWVRLERYCDREDSKKHFIKVLKKAGFKIGGLRMWTGGKNPENIFIKKGTIYWDKKHATKNN